MDLAQSMLGFWVADYPQHVLPIFDAAAWDVVIEFFPNYGTVAQKVTVRISELPVQESIRDIRQTHMNCLIRVDGVITRCTAIFPKLSLVKFDCQACGYTAGPFETQDDPDSA